MSGKGRVVIGGYSFPVTDVRLKDGGVTVSFDMRGPLPEFSGHITIFGEDGKGVMQGHEITVRGLEDGEFWTCQEQMNFTKIESWSQSRTY